MRPIAASQCGWTQNVAMNYECCELDTPNLQKYLAAECGDYSDYSFQSHNMEFLNLLKYCRLTIKYYRDA
jgi:hypothetical protein